MNFSVVCFQPSYDTTQSSVQTALIMMINMVVLSQFCNDLIKYIKFIPRART